MLDTSVPVGLKSQRNSRRVAFICVVLLAIAATPLHAQFTYQDLNDFNCNTGGCYPFNFGSLTQIVDGSFIGSTQYLGETGYGTLFAVTTPVPVSYGDIFDFNINNTYGLYPTGEVTLASDGNFYTTVSGGGANGHGTVFAIYGGVPLNLHDFTIEEGGGNPPVQGKDNNLYGVTNSGPAYTIVITPTSATYKSIGTQTPGLSFGPLFLASDGNLYGTTEAGGKNNLGTVFRMTTPKGAIKTIYSFNGSQGSNPDAPLIQGSDGNLYGTAQAGGTNNTGVIFKITLAGKLTVLFNFDADEGGSCNTFGKSPAPGLMAAPDGNFYGVTTTGGANCFGTIFQLSKGGIVTKLFDFTGNSGAVPGQKAFTTLKLHTNGNFYGLTESGGANGEGVYFRIAPPNPIQILTVVGPIFVEPGVPVEILGNGLTQTLEVTFGAVQAQYQIGSDTNLTATVPTDAIDAAITVTLNTGLQIQTMGAVHILPMITNLDPSSGPVGTQVAIVGGGFAGATKVTFGGVKATSFTVATPSLIQAFVPTGAKTGKVTVTTPNGTATSKQKFTVN